MNRSTVLTVLCALVSAPAWGNALDSQRLLFDAKYREVLKGATPRAETLAALKNYPLLPWLEYWPLRRNLRALPTTAVRAFLARYPASLPGERLRTDWLRETVRQGRFDLFRADYAPQSDPDLQCHALRLTLEDAPSSRATHDALQLWQTGRSQAPACDPVFASLRARGALTAELIRQRILLAARAGNTALGVAIARRYGSAEDRAYADLLHKVRGTPSRTLALTAGKPATPALSEAVAVGLARYAPQSLANATRAWEAARARHAFEPAQAGAVERALALAAAAVSHPRLMDYLRAVNPAGVDDAIERLRLREGLRARAWRDLLEWTRDPPRGATTNPLRWRYWHARALAETGQREAALQRFRALAKERDYYGFLAADRAGVPYEMINRPIAPTAEERAQIGNLGGMVRAYEFRRINRLGDARAELAFELDGRELRVREVAAALVNDWGWQAQTILMLGQMQSYDDLDLRFPTLHRPLVLKFATARGLPPALIYAIIRGESGFVTEARSPVGALGLMQVMPATARATARHIGLRLRYDAELTQVDKNIAIGSEYLRQVLRQFGGFFPLAAAAYNAGPSRVRAWLKQAACTPEDVWVDTLPFAETEGYVRRALFYAAIYESRLKLTITPLASRMNDMTRFGASSPQTC